MGLSNEELAFYEDDREVHNLIYNRLQMDHNTTDGELQREVIELFGLRYPDMTLNDWRHIISDYTRMVREAAQPKAQEIPLQQFDRAAEESMEE